MSLHLKTTNNGPDWMPEHPMRRLSDKILIAFHHACDQGDVEVARRLLDLLEFMLKRRHRLPDGTDRRAQESLVAAYERLWEIRHPGVDDGQP